MTDADERLRRVELDMIAAMSSHRALAERVDAAVDAQRDAARRAERAARDLRDELRHHESRHRDDRRWARTTAVGVALAVIGPWIDDLVRLL